MATRKKAAPVAEPVETQEVPVSVEQKEEPKGVPHGQHAEELHMGITKYTYKGTH